MDLISLAVTAAGALLGGGVAWGLVTGRVSTLERSEVAQTKTCGDHAKALAEQAKELGELKGKLSVAEQRVTALETQHDQVRNDLASMEGRLMVALREASATQAAVAAAQASGVKDAVAALRRELEAAGALARPRA